MTRTDNGDTPAVSVVVATRDRPGLLQRTIAAILEQDYPGPVECLVVFDQCNPDHSIERTDANRSVRSVRNLRTPGLAGARNSGAVVAQGQWLAFCDDDDMWHTDKLRRQLARAAETPTVDVVCAGVTINYDGRLIDRVPTEADVAYSALLRSRAAAAHPSSVIVNRSVFLEDIGLVDEQMPGSYGEDYDWLLRAARRGPIGVVPDSLVTVLWGKTSFFADRWSTIIESITYLLRKHPDFAAEPTGMARLYARMAFAHAALGHRGAARSLARKSLRLNWRERRAYVAFLVSAGVVSPDAALRLAHGTGRGI